MTRRRAWMPTAGAVTVLLLAVACGASGDAEPVLSPAGERGRSISRDNGCAACHGRDGEGGVGPTWIGLAGSEVELLDGTLVVADDDYLVRAIVDPAADLRAGWALQMPVNRLSDSEVADVVAYINELAASAE